MTVIKPADVLSEVIDCVHPSLHAICHKICQLIPEDVQVYIGADSETSDIPDDLKGGICFTGRKNVVISIEADGLAVLNDFTSTNRDSINLNNIHNTNDSDTLIEFVKKSLVPQLIREKEEND